jgi:hypothetical protein
MSYFKKSIIELPNVPIMVLWCGYCDKEIDIDKIALGTVSCPVCRRKLRWKELIWKEGCISMRQEKFE